MQLLFFLNTGFSEQIYLSDLRSIAKEAGSIVYRKFNGLSYFLAHDSSRTQGLNTLKVIELVRVHKIQ